MEHIKSMLPASRKKSMELLFNSSASIYKDYESSEVAVNVRLREIEKLLLESHLLDREIGVVLNQ